MAASGIPTEADHVAACCRRTGRGPIAGWNFHLAFALFRLAAIGQGVYVRALAGVTPTAGEAVNGTPRLAEQAPDPLRRQRVRPLPGGLLEPV